jgi:hypothetical protein
VRTEEVRTTMEWDPFLAWELGHAPSTPIGDNQPSDLDLWLVRLAYEVIAGESACQACSARLGRSLRVTPLPTSHPSSRWRVSIATRCNGWRRHRNHAEAVLGQDLLFGALARTSPRA